LLAYRANWRIIMDSATMTQKTELSWATVNTTDPPEIAEFYVQQERLANERAKAAFERLKLLGIIDEHRESIGEERPPDTRSGAKRYSGA
jgi:hypothetical protein